VERGGKKGATQNQGSRRVAYYNEQRPRNIIFAAVMDVPALAAGECDG